MPNLILSIFCVAFALVLLTWEIYAIVRSAAFALRWPAELLNSSLGKKAMTRKSLFLGEYFNLSLLPKLRPALTLGAVTTVFSVLLAEFPVVPSAGLGAAVATAAFLMTGLRVFKMSLNEASHRSALLHGFRS